MRGEADWGALLLRVGLGIIFVMHGYLAFAVLGPRVAAGYIVRMGYPQALADVLAWYLIVAHTVGGILMMLGFWTRVAALAQLPIMASALFLLHAQQGFFMKGIILDAPAGRAIAGGYEFSFLVLVATLAVILIGPGAFALDRPPDRRVADTRPV